MLKSHFYFSLFVGAVLVVLGNALSSQNSVGWTLISLGVAIPILAIVSQQFGKASDDASDETPLLEPIKISND